MHIYHMMQKSDYEIDNVKNSLQTVDKPIFYIKP